MKHLTLLIVCMLSACGLSNDTSPPIIDGDWPVDRPVAKSVAPGEHVQLHVTNVDVPLVDAVVWVGDTNELALRPFKIDDGTTADDGDATFTIAAPFLRAGDHVLYLGTKDGPRTGAIPFDVVVPAPRLPKAEAARLFANGLDHYLVVVEELLAHPDPEWQATWGGAYPSDVRAKMTTLITSARAVRSEVEADYLALSDEQEAAFQSMLERSGVLFAFETTDGIDALHAKPLDGPLDQFPHAIAYVLYALDATSTATSILGDTLTIVNTIAVFVPGFQAVALVGVEAEIMINTMRFLIDALVPTDLHGIESQGQSDLYDLHSHRYPYWGEFSTEHQERTELFGSLDDLIASLIGAALPDFPGVKALQDKIAPLITSVFAKLGIKKVLDDYAILPKDLTPPRWKVVLNMAAYSASLADLYVVFPHLTMMKLLNPTFLVDGQFNVVGGVPAWATTSDVKYTFLNDTMALTETQWPAGETHPVGEIVLNASAYRWTTEDFAFVLNRPITKTSVVGDVIKIHYLDFAVHDPNVTPEDSRLLIQRTGIVDRNTPTQYTVPIVMRDLAGGRGDVAHVQIKVNGQIVIADAALPDGQNVNGTLVLDRTMVNHGVNEIEVIALAGHVIPFTINGHDRAFAMKLTVPDAVQPDKARDVGLHVGQAHKIYVSLPPPM
jgi:hypothetical protein